MRLKDVPVFPAYVVFHDAYARGAMEVFPVDSMTRAVLIATKKQETLDQSGYDDSGTWRAYEKLPRVKVCKLHTLEQTAILETGIK